MAPKKLNPLPKVPERPTKKRQTVSLSKIFANRAAVRHPKIVKVPTPKKKKEPPPHPVIQEFDDSIASTRTHLLISTLDSLSAAHKDLSTHLSSSLNTAKSSFNRQSKLHSIITRPLASHTLSFTGSDQAILFQSTIGERMARFEAKVKELAGELNDLWEENDRVDWEIEKFAKDVMPWTYRKEGEDIEVKKIEREGEGLKEKMEELCSEAMERMKESEKELKVRSRKEKKHIQQFLDTL